MSHSWPENASGSFQNFDEVAGEIEVWAFLLRLLPLQHDPRAAENQWMDVSVCSCFKSYVLRPLFVKQSVRVGGKDPNATQ